MYRTLSNAVLLVALATVLIWTTGCGKKEEAKPQAPAPVDHDHATPAAKAHEEEFHSHDHGPKGGLLAILGSHQFHAEFMPDETTGVVTAYVYNDHFKPVALDAKELTLNIMVGGQPKKFDLLVENDGADGKEATFQITDADLAKLLKAGWEGKAQVSITVKGKPASGDLVPQKK